MNRPSFYWWDDAVDVAIQIGETSGVKQRVTKTDNAAQPWRVVPALLRSVPHGMDARVRAGVRALLIGEHGLDGDAEADHSGGEFADGVLNVDVARVVAPPHRLGLDSDSPDHLDQFGVRHESKATAH